MSDLPESALFDAVRAYVARLAVARRDGDDSPA
jgi:hypothetical protein